MSIKVRKLNLREKQEELKHKYQEITDHYSYERDSRDYFIKVIGEGEPIAAFEVDNNHKNGPELHFVTDNAIIIIYNAATLRLVTKLIARPGQIKRYWPDGDWPRDIVNIAFRHQIDGYNDM